MQQQAAIDHLAGQWANVPAKLKENNARRHFARELSTCAPLFVVEGRPFQIIVTENYGMDPEVTADVPVSYNTFLKLTPAQP